MVHDEEPGVLTWHEHHQRAEARHVAAMLEHSEVTNVVLVEAKCIAWYGRVHRDLLSMHFRQRAVTEDARRGGPRRTQMGDQETSHVGDRGIDRRGRRRVIPLPRL